MSRLSGCSSNLNIIDFGIAVQEAREDLNIPVSDLAKMIGCTDQRLINIEAFGFSTRSKYFEPLCELLGLDQNHFKKMEERLIKLQQLKVQEIKRKTAREYARTHRLQQRQYQKKRYRSSKEAAAC